MNFKTQPIRKNRPEKSPKKSSAKKAKFLTIGSAILILLLLVWGALTVAKNFHLSSIIFSFSQKLQVDENGNTNILLVGVGGEGHDGSDLTDTIILASINYDQKLVPMLSIPRDLHVKSTNITDSYGDRINRIYSLGKNKTKNPEQGMEDLKQIVSEVTGVPIQYAIKVDFEGFKKIVDSLGGVDVTVEKDIYDVEYPLGETIHYQTFSLKKGPQHLDGETALKYARSRHGKGNERSDFDRSARQQQLLEAIKEKALQLNLLTDAGKIYPLYNSLSSSIETDLTLNELIELAKIGKDLGKESIVRHLLTDIPFSCGGFLYTPPREQFGGAAVMKSKDKNYESIHFFTENLFKNPLLFKKQGSIQVLNGTKTPNMAGEVSEILTDLCLNVVYFGNAQDRNLETSTIYYQPDEKGVPPEELEFVKKLLPFPTQAGIPEAYLNTEKKKGTLIVIELGADYTDQKIDLSKHTDSTTSNKTSS
jgi:LCP family protein required for cell wall assembly